MVERTDNAARRWLWKRVSPRARNFFFPRLSRIVDPSGLGRYPNVVFEIRSFDLFPRAFPRARSRLLGEKRAISRPAEMHCPFENRTGGRRYIAGGPATGIDGEGVDGASAFTRARVKEEDRYLHAAWPRVARDGTSTA